MKSTSAARTGSMAMKPISQAFCLAPVEHFAGRGVDDVIDRHAEPLGERRREFGCDTVGLAIRPLLRQHAVAEIDRGAEFAGRRQVLENLERRRILRESANEPAIRMIKAVKSLDMVVLPERDLRALFCEY